MARFITEDEEMLEENEHDYSFFSRDVYPIHRWPYFITGLKIWALAIGLSLVACLLLLPFHSNESSFSILQLIVYIIISIPILFLGVMNDARRMADLAWATDSKKLILISVAIRFLPLVPILGSIAYFIIWLILLFQRSRID